MKTKFVLIPCFCIGNLMAVSLYADEAGMSTSSAAPSAEILEAENRQAMETQGEVSTNAYWDEEEDESLADEEVEVKASYDPEDDASPAELEIDEENMPAVRRYREEITVEEFRPDD